MPADDPAPGTPAAGVFLLRTPDVAVLVDARGAQLPAVLHWGADLGDLDPAAREAVADATTAGIPSSSIDRPRRVTLLPQHATGYAGRATLTGSRAGGSWSPLFHHLGTRPAQDGSEQVLHVDAVDDLSGLRLRTEIRLAACGQLRLRHAVTNAAATPFMLLGLPGILPVPAHATELLNLTGRHLKERVPQRLPFAFGSWVREQRRGRTGHDAPLVLAAGTPGFRFREGEVWAVHVAWSGDATTFAERLPEGWSGIGGGELLQPTEVELEPGQQYVAPWLYFTYSGKGLDGIAATFSAGLRARATHPRRPRPVVLNTWEAVYFQHDLRRLTLLADAAARVGVERFVLDDGWFGSRRDDSSGLGDWYVSPEVWPQGLQPLIRHVVDLGMEFGLWVEPEMVNPDSELARAHPDWLLALPERTPPTARRQQVLDINRPEVYAYLRERLHTLLTEHPIRFLKWDHNRDVVDAAHATADGRRPGIHAQTLALYRLIDDLRRLHPELEIESCAGGGGRIDLGILQRTDRVWVSDSNDPLERQQIQRWTGLLLPPELMGTHVGPPKAHTTGRVSDLDFRAGTALFGHFGIEWDLTSAGAEDLAALADWVGVYLRFRALLHSGRMVRSDPQDEAALVHGVVSAPRDEALFAYVQLGTSTYAPPPPFRLPELDPRRRYRVHRISPAGTPRLVGSAAPAWFRDGGQVLPGSALMTIGLPVPPIAPEQLILLHLTGE